METVLTVLGNPSGRAGLSFAVLALLLAWESFSPFLSFFAGRTAERTRHAFRNLALGVINAVLNGLLFAALWWSAAEWAHEHRFGLLHWIPLPSGFRLLAAFLLFDAWMYVWHRLNHRVAFLWRFHRTHHSDPEMDVTTASRFHSGEIVISALLRVFLIPLMGIHLEELALYEAVMFTVVQLHHANIALPRCMDGPLRLVIVTPHMHKVHHSCYQPETDSNYSSLFSFWDRLFGTFRLREDPKTIRFGLEEFPEPDRLTLRNLLSMPFKYRRTERSVPQNATFRSESAVLRH